MSLLMGRHSTSQIVRRADVDVAIAQFEEVDVPHVVAVSLRSYGASGDTLRSAGFRVARHPKPVRAKGGGAGGIRTLDRALQPYNGLANRRLQPLGHSSISADMPDTGASRKRQIQITPRLFRDAGASRAFLASSRYSVLRVWGVFPGPVVSVNTQPARQSHGVRDARPDLCGGVFTVGCLTRRVEIA
jgi:hypothetical protein